MVHHTESDGTIIIISLGLVRVGSCELWGGVSGSGLSVCCICVLCCVVVLSLCRCILFSVVLVYVSVELLFDVTNTAGVECVDSGRLQRYWWFRLHRVPSSVLTRTTCCWSFGPLVLVATPVLASWVASLPHHRCLRLQFFSVEESLRNFSSLLLHYFFLLAPGLR